MDTIGIIEIGIIEIGIIEIAMIIVAIAMIGILKTERDCYKRGGKGLRSQYHERFSK